MELKSDQHLTIKDETHSKLTEKRSKFLGWAAPIQSENDVETFLEKVRKEHHNPTHIVYAYRLRQDNSLREYSTDDGEPTYSAGQPVLKVLQGNNLENIICAVIRYYGGVKLGVGGLIRAYSGAAKLAIDQATIITKTQEEKLAVQVTYAGIGIVVNIVEDLGGNVENMEYEADSVTIHIRLRGSLAETFWSKFKNDVPYHFVIKSK